MAIIDGAPGKHRTTFTIKSGDESSWTADVECVRTQLCLPRIRRGYYVWRESQLVTTWLVTYQGVIMAKHRTLSRLGARKVVGASLLAGGMLFAIPAGAASANVGDNLQSILGGVGNNLQSVVGGTANNVQSIVGGGAQNVEAISGGTAKNVQKITKGTLKNVQKITKGTLKNVQKITKGTLKNVQKIVHHL
jgi:hypothetical protein